MRDINKGMYRGGDRMALVTTACGFVEKVAEGKTSYESRTDDQNQNKANSCVTLRENT